MIHTLSRKTAAATATAVLTLGGVGLVLAPSAQASGIQRVSGCQSSSSGSAYAFGCAFGSGGLFSGQVIQIPISHSINICGPGNYCSNS
ncbi:chaplin family protein [Streptacidiphilus rugosus]|uniref:chaplin family protein n=1 Tax=Streptacidiphilus rugosus TaxID=405783 RepID=UPI0018DCEE02|nr:chaplin family protein [Streptacidiphilus rugosus]